MKQDERKLVSDGSCDEVEGSRRREMMSKGRLGYRTQTMMHSSKAGGMS